MYSFPKGARFDEIRNVTPAKFYNPKTNGCFTQKRKNKGPSMGFGKRFTEGFINPGSAKTPGPNILPSTLIQAQFSIKGREAFMCEGVYIEGDKRPDRDNPGPGSYFQNNFKPVARKNLVKMCGGRTEHGSIFGIQLKNARETPAVGAYDIPEQNLIGFAANPERRAYTRQF